MCSLQLKRGKHKSSTFSAVRGKAKKKHRMPKNGAAIDVTQCVGKEQRNYNLTALVVCLCPTADEKFLLLLNINSSCWISVERKEPTRTEEQKHSSRFR